MTFVFHYQNFQNFSLQEQSSRDSGDESEVPLVDMTLPSPPTSSPEQENDSMKIEITPLAKVRYQLIKKQLFPDVV